jgi:hypothetical protein
MSIGLNITVESVVVLMLVIVPCNLKSQQITQENPRPKQYVFLADVSNRYEDSSSHSFEPYVYYISEECSSDNVDFI